MNRRSRQSPSKRATRKRSSRCSHRLTARELGRRVLGGYLLLALTLLVLKHVQAEVDPNHSVPPVMTVEPVDGDEAILTPTLSDDWQRLIRNAWQQAQQHQDASQQQNDEAREALLAATMANDGSPGERPTPQVMVFVSLGMPNASLRQLLAQANDLQVPLILRGLYQDNLLTTAKRIQQLLNEDSPSSAHIDADKRTFMPGGMAIHPQWFSQLNIQQVPTVVVIRPGHCLPTRASQPSSCTDHDVDRVQGNVSLYDALALLAAHGDVPDIAQQVLARRKSAISHSATSMGSQP